MDFAGAQFEIGAVERARGAERLVDAAKVKKRRRVRCREGHAVAGAASRRSAQISLANTVCLRVGNRVSRLARVTAGMGTVISFSGVSPSRWRSRRRPLAGYQIGLLHARHQQFARTCGSSMNSGMPSKAAVSTCPGDGHFYGAQRAYRRLVGLKRRARVDRDWPPACPGCRKVFRPCRLCIRRPARRPRAAGAQAVQEALVRAWPFLRACEMAGYAESAVLPASFPQPGGQRLTHRHRRRHSCRR